MELKRNGSTPSARGPAEYFTGTVRIDQLFRAPGPARASGVLRHVRAMRAQQLAHASARSDAHRHLRLRLGAEVGRPDQGDSPRRSRVVSAGRKALARRIAHHGHDAYRHPGGAQRQGGRLDGDGDRRTVQRPRPRNEGERNEDRDTACIALPGCPDRRWARGGQIRRIADRLSGGLPAFPQRPGPGPGVESVSAVRSTWTAATHPLRQETWHESS